jgi:3-hydroxybutyryl-CoA dehydrogenase
MKLNNIAVIGAGTMGAGIAQIAAAAGHRVILIDTFPNAIQKAKDKHQKDLQTLVEKGKMTAEQTQTLLNLISYEEKIEAVATTDLVIEAIVEDLHIKQTLFKQLESLVNENCILATNTSSLSIASISSVLNHKNRFLGIHFFNPAPIMPLVEIIPGVATNEDLGQAVKSLMLTWKKLPVLTKDTPGFIVNRVARPYYSEAIRIYEEGIADFNTIDHAMKSLGGFKMGPFELMDFIGHDVNYRVTESVWTQLFYDPRFKPSITQKRLFEAGLYGKKSSKGFYIYHPDKISAPANEDTQVLKSIFDRIICMLINEAYDALYFQIASKEDLEIAMTKGVNYPKGLLAWGEEIGLSTIMWQIQQLYDLYNEERYRPSIGLKNFISKK